MRVSECLRESRPIRAFLGAPVVSSLTKSTIVVLIFVALATGVVQGQASSRRHGTARACTACAPCSAQTPILESGRPPLPGEEGSGVQSCKLLNTSAEWDAYCGDNVVPDCPLLDDAFFSEHTVVAIAIDTLTTRPCEGSPDPLWRLDCVATRSRDAGVRVVKQRPGGWCLCSAMPQQLQRLFLASAVPKTEAAGCRTCEESHTIDCRPF